MAKPVYIDGVPHRKRRGKLVPIPAEWVGKTVSQQKKNKRNSKTREKKIASKQIRAEEQAAMAHDEEPNPNLRKKLHCWWSTSGRVDQHRNKYRNNRLRNHPSV